jgi:hypothetical protein
MPEPSVRLPAMMGAAGLTPGTTQSLIHGLSLAGFCSPALVVVWAESILLGLPELILSSVL